MFKFGGKKGIWELISVVGSRHNALSLKSIMHVYAGVWLGYGKKIKKFKSFIFGLSCDSRNFVSLRSNQEYGMFSITE